MKITPIFSMLLALLISTMAIVAQQKPRVAPKSPMFEFGVEKCAGNICIKANQDPTDAPDQFRVEVKAMAAPTDRALVTVFWEVTSGAGGTPEIHTTQAMTDKQPRAVAGALAREGRIVKNLPATAVVVGVPRPAVTSIRVALVKIDEVERQEFR